MSETTDILADIIRREKEGIAGSTEVRAGIEIVKLRGLLAGKSDAVAALLIENERLRQGIREVGRHGF